jgi:peptidyl-prolyl cis-trans isomerase B (cyclophilin B)
MRRFALTLALLAVVAAVFAIPTGAEKMKNPNDPVVVISTSMGDMEVELYKNEAPITVQNFEWYVKNGFYDGLIFHRVIDNFMIQGGGFTPDMKKKAGNEPIENEATNGISNDKYTIAMARTNAVHSATSQFFINNQDNPALNHSDTTQRGFGYCVFGKVIAGQDVVDKISKVETTTKNGMQDVPVEPVVITKVWMKGKDKGSKSEKKSEKKSE